MRMLSGTSSCLKSYTSGLLWKIPLTPTPVYTYFTHTKQARICVFPLLGPPRLGHITLARNCPAEHNPVSQLTSPGRRLQLTSPPRLAEHYPASQLTSPGRRLQLTSPPHLAEHYPASL
ncbi:hypothetical protein PCANC_05927 [Puccinia coronata f. sp. avenae]|uniref:Uncharacterized protein n=1 Tax=Puccinia coronata f. sp. avenae TaxID=200324 RepID=A0A2N5TXJ8_9BASI|nr:hypothetical protein PCASD_16336 [Puccinia coronata f. sp. avenae]PLW54876.1 hypothetical protein PCANC_05927 [Puccinia coronata f. sp. avenae]